MQHTSLRKVPTYGAVWLRHHWRTAHAARARITRLDMLHLLLHYAQLKMMLPPCSTLMLHERT